MTSQSRVMVRSPSSDRSAAARRERPIRRWISSVRTALPAAGGLARGALAGRAWQHAVLGGDPAALAALEKVRHPLLDRGVAQDPGVAELHEDGALGVSRVAADETQGAHLVRAAQGWSHVGSSVIAVGKHLRRRWERRQIRRLALGRQLLKADCESNCENSEKRLAGTSAACFRSALSSSPASRGRRVASISMAQSIASSKNGG